MSVNSIIEKINEKADLEIKDILADGEKKANELEKSILDKALKEVKNIIDNANDEAKRIKNRQVIISGLEERKARLWAKKKLLNEAFDEALNKLLNLDEISLKKLVKRLVVENCMAGDVVLVVPESNLKIYEDKEFLKHLVDEVTEKIKQPVNLEIESSDKIKGGVLIKGRLYDVDASFEILLDEVRRDFEKEVCQMLFGSEE